MDNFTNKNDIAHEVFISYRRKYGWELALLISEQLEKAGISTFYDQKVLPGLLGTNLDWPEKIKYNIQHCDVFILVVSGKSIFYCGGEKKKNQRDWPDNDNMWDEYEQVLEINKTRDEDKKISIIPVFSENYIEPDSIFPVAGQTNDEYGYWGKSKEQGDKYRQYFSDIKRKEGVELDPKNAFNRLRDLAFRINSLISKRHKEIKQKQNAFYEHSDSQKEQDNEEVKRLESQARNQLPELKNVICNKLIQQKESYVLDIGCANGYKTNKLFGQYSSIKYLLGIDNSKDWIKDANEKYGHKNEFQEFEFKCCNVLESEFEDILRDAVEKNYGKKFNIVHIGLVLLHLGEPRKVIETISKYMESGGFIIINEVDDALLMPYVTDASDEEHQKELNEFLKKYLDITYRLTTDGNRFMGRRVYGLLEDEFKDIKIEHSIYRDFKANYDEKDAQENFNSALKNARNEFRKIQNNLTNSNTRTIKLSVYSNDIKWLEINEEKIVNLLKSKGYFSSSYELIFTGIKK